MGIYFDDKPNTTIDGIEIYNTYYADTAGSGSGIWFFGASSNVEIKNCFILYGGNQSIRAAPGDGSDSILIHDNVFTSCNRMFIAVSDGTVVNDIQIYDNEFNGNEGFTGTAHGDGIMIGSDCTAANTCLTNLKIFRNLFHGDWTHGASGLIFLNNGTGSGDDQYGGNHVEIHNNVLAIDSDGNIPNGDIYIWSC